MVQRTDTISEYVQAEVDTCKSMALARGKTIKTPQENMFALNKTLCLATQPRKIPEFSPHCIVCLLPLETIP